MITLLDGFVDEPSCLGVPPYISPYVRYIAGAIRDAEEEYEYITIEDWRKGKQIKGDVLVISTGAIVPGRYLRGMPISFKEFVQICKNFRGIKILTGSAAKYGIGRGGGREPIEATKYVDYAPKKDGDAFVYEFLHGEKNDRRRTIQEWRKWSLLGAEVVKHHPDFPQPLIAEIESYRGCIRWFTGGCSFCIESSFGKPIFRQERDIVEEVKELKRQGATNFRLGGQSCFFSYKAVGIGKKERPMPNESAIHYLLKEISDLQPSVFHIDNANPAVVAEWPEKSRRVAEMIAEYCTSGNVAAFGMESADEKVIKMNNLNALPEEVMEAIKIINEVGKERGENGMPKFLPGLNILYGLRGESKKTYQKNLKFLKEVMERGFLLRRINIRQVVNIRGEKTKVVKSLFIKFKREVNEKINLPILKKMVPRGSILKNVYLEINIGNHTFGRQVGSYPLLVGLPYKHQVGKFINVKILSHSYKSVIGIEYPLNINKASMAALESIPKIGEKRAARIIRNRPYKNLEEIEKYISDKEIMEELKKWIVV